MDQIRVTGGKKLKGKIEIVGAKNAALPLLMTTLLTDQPVVLENVPKLSDIRSMCELLEHMGTEIDFSLWDSQRQLTFQTKQVKEFEAPYEIVRKMRASILALGPTLARHGMAKVSLPGGCAIGTRPVNFHIDGMEKLGATIEIEHGYIVAKAPQGLTGTDITLPLPSVTGTENLMMAAVLAKGTTRLINAAKEPEIADLARCLIGMGAQISGIDTSTLIITGVSTLRGVKHFVLPDRIEAGTYAVAAAISDGEIEIVNGQLEHLPGFRESMEQAGVLLAKTPSGFLAKRSSGVITGTDVITEYYPGFATDLQAQFMALMTIADGVSVIKETIWENRFMHVAELNRMGANIRTQGNNAIVRGVKKLSGASVMATDLRASVSLILAGLVAKGDTFVNRVYHLDRGYEAIEAKLSACGANIERIKVEDPKESETNGD